MKLQPDKFDVQAITGYGPGWVKVDADTKHHSLLLTSRGHLVDWNCQRYDDLGAEHFAMLAELKPELVIFGSGDRIRFPKPQWLQPLMALRIGLETMDTPAACRTYNILAQEGRHVAVALLLEPSA